jgi:hypothetical protein
MEAMLLREQEIAPTEEVIENALGDSFSAYQNLIKTITDTHYGLVPQWNYYKDGKAWLCKVCYKKKTIFWLSVWDKFFKTTFYFTEKNGTGVAGLDIEEKIKESFSCSKSIGRLIPLTIAINGKDQIKDVLKIVEYKKNLK